MNIYKQTDTNLIETIPGLGYSMIHPRCLDNEGCVIDLGSFKWEWSSFFLDKKRIIGADPFGTQIPGTELFKGVVGPFDGTSVISDEDIGSSVFSDKRGTQVEMLSWKSFCKNFYIDKISILKINIEGAEYPLLNSMDVDDFNQIDQIVVSFHNWINPKWKNLTKSSISLLQDHGFKIIQIYERFGWYLALK
jgi:hypothetical protein